MKSFYKLATELGSKFVLKQALAKSANSTLEAAKALRATGDDYYTGRYGWEWAMAHAAAYRKSPTLPRYELRDESGGKMLYVPTLDSPSGLKTRACMAPWKFVQKPQAANVVCDNN